MIRSFSFARKVRNSSLVCPAKRPLNVTAASTSAYGRLSVSRALSAVTCRPQYLWGEIHRRGFGTNSKDGSSDNSDDSRKEDSDKKGRHDAHDFFSEILHFGFDVTVFLSIYYAISQYGFTVTTCIGPSMEPTFNTQGDVVLVDKFSYSVLGKRFEKGDVIIAICPYDTEKTVCKRVAATEGDVILTEYKGRQLRVSVPEGHVWLLGDNQSNSTDSRYYGHVPEGLLRGRVVLKLSSPFGQLIERRIVGDMKSDQYTGSDHLDADSDFREGISSSMHTQMKGAKHVVNNKVKENK